MTSGVYKLTFSDGSFYIGKSDNIERRWNQHSKNMADGKHTIKLQHAYNRCGEPDYKVLLYCHRDHVDIFEASYIHQTKDWPGSLNTSIPPNPGVNIEYEFPQDILDMSTLEHIDQIRGLKERVSSLEQELLDAEEAFEETLADIKSGTRLLAVEAEVKLLDELYQHTLNDRRAVEKELEVYKNRGFFSRLFNF